MKSLKRKLKTRKLKKIRRNKRSTCIKKRGITRGGKGSHHASHEPTHHATEHKPEEHKPEEHKPEEKTKTKEQLAAKHKTEKDEQANRHKKEKDDLKKKHDDEMAAAKTPEEKAALTKKHAEEDAALKKKQKNEDKELAQKHKNEENQRAADEAAAQGQGQGGPPQLSLGSMGQGGPGSSGYGSNGFGGPGNGSSNGSSNGSNGSNGSSNGSNSGDLSGNSGDLSGNSGANGSNNGANGSNNGANGPNGAYGRNGAYGSNSSAYGSVKSDALQGQIVPGSPIEIKDTDYSGPRDNPFQYKIPFEKDGLTGMLKTQFMTKNVRGYKYYMVYGQSIKEIEDTIKGFAKVVETQDSPRGDFVGSLKDLINKLKADVEATESIVDNLQSEFNDVNQEDSNNASDTLKLMQDRLSDLVEQLAAAERIQSRGFK